MRGWTSAGCPCAIWQLATPLQVKGTAPYMSLGATWNEYQNAGRTPHGTEDLITDQD
jgi:hypothetical protein